MKSLVQSTLEYSLSAYNFLYWKILKPLPGAHKFKMYLKEKVDREQIVKIDYKGTKFFAPLKSAQALDIYTKSKNDELKVLNYLIRNIDDEAEFIDIGSGYGFYSQIICDKTNADVKAFDIAPENVLCQKLSKTYFDRDLEVFEKAVMDKTGSFGISQNEDSTHTTVDYEREGEISGVKLDDAVDSADFLKIDVEGAEMTVLRGMEKLISSCRPKGIIELHPNKLPKYGSTEEEVIKFLENNNYVVSNLTDRHILFE